MILSRGTRVVVSVLDWGLGHAGRSSVIVRTLVSRGCRVTLAGSGRSLAMLASEFPELEVVPLRSFSPRLGAIRWLWVEILLQLPSFIWSVFREYRDTQALVRRVNPDLIVSDNRYGVWSHRCVSVFVTHQLRPHVAPGAPRWVERSVSSVLCRFVRNFDCCLVPDVRLGGLSGDLSSPVPHGMRVHCVGLLSRLALAKVSDVGTVAYLGIASGPEPQRSAFVSYLVARFDGLDGRRVVVSGGAFENAYVSAHGVEVLPMADAETLRALVLAAGRIVCRSGYTTVLDFAALGVLDGRVEFIPTEGQAEQVYLAGRFASGSLSASLSSPCGWLRGQSGEGDS